MKTKNQQNAFLGFGALTLLTATLGGLSGGCVADRPSRNSVYDENQYIRKDFLIRPGDATNAQDPGWLLKATITDASEPNVYGGQMYGLYAGAHNDGQLVHFVVTSDTMEMINNINPSSEPSVGVQGEVVNAWPVTNVDLKYYINLDGEKTNNYVESLELDWQLRQWVKVNLDKNNMADLAPLGSFVTANLATCVGSEGSATLVPNSFIVDEAHDYMEWSVQITMPITWSDTCMETYGELGPAAQRLGRQYETVTLKYSMMRALANPLAPQTSYAENQNGTTVPGYTPLIIAEKDPIQHKYSPFTVLSWNTDPSTELTASNKMVARKNPARNQRWYFEKGFPDQYKNIFTSTNLPPGVQPLPAGVPTIQDSTNQALAAAQAADPNHAATGRISFHEYNEPLDDGTPIERSFGDVRFNMLRWVESVNQQGLFAGVTGWVTDPRTGESLSSDIVFENFAIRDYYVTRIDAYLQTIGASANLYSSGDWGNPTCVVGDTPNCIPDAKGSATGTLPPNCNVGDAVPLVPQVVTQTHNGQSTLYQKMQNYLYRPSSTYGALGPQDFVPQQDADFFRAYYAYLPYIIYTDSATNPYVTPVSDGATTAPPSQTMWNLINGEQQYHALAGAIDRGYVPYDQSSPTGSMDALNFMNQYKALSINHRNYKYAQKELGSILAANHMGNDNNAQDTVTSFSMEAIMAKDARHCVVTAANPSAHWESKQEWTDSLIQTYWSQVMWHEFGHAMGLRHNFMASIDQPNFPVQMNSAGQPVLDANGNPKYKLYSSSVMEYNATPDRVFWGAGWGPYDVGALEWIYSNSGTTTALPKGVNALGASGQTSATFPWNDPAGWRADGTEIQYLTCTEEQTKYTPLCRDGDIGITPSEITANEIDNYEWQYAWRNFRQFHKVWDDSNYANQPQDFVSEARRFLSLWSYDMSSGELTAVFQRLGITPPPDSPSAQLYYQALTNKFNTEMSAAAALTTAFHEAIIEQSPGQRPYVTQQDAFFGDVTVQGIALDKLDALQSFLALWPVDNYDQVQASGAYISSFAPFGYIASATGSGVGSIYQTVAEDAVMAMLAGTYAAYPYFAPLGDAIFTQDTQSVNYVSFGGRQDARDWTGGYSFSRNEDFLAYFQNIAVQNNFQVPRLGINCDTLADCAGANGNTPYDPRLAQAFPTDYFYSNNLNQFQGPNGRRYIWIYIQERNQWVVADQDRNIETYQVFLGYTSDIIQSGDDGNSGSDTGALSTYGFLQEVEYFVDYYMQFNNQYVQNNLGG
jgi:hypothetical protein